MPETVELRASAPPGLDERAAARWVSRVRRAVAAREVELAAHRRRKGIKLVGRKNVLQTDPLSAPRTETRHRKLRPCLACKDEERMEQARTELRTFWTRYWKVLEEFRGGARDVTFPVGTYRMRMLGACCSPFRKRPAA